jgi:hypothetical protein
MQIFFSGYNRGEPLANFPVLVNLGTNVPGFSYQQFASPSGSDLRFTDESGLIMIPFEIDQWNTNGASSVWVNVPLISSNDDFIWAYWGNPFATDLPASSTNGEAWPGYDLVWHLRENAFPYADSTLNYPAKTGVAPVQTTGIVGNGQQFNGSSTFLDAGTVNNLNNAFTLSAWVNVSTANNNIQTIWANQKGGFGSAGFALFVNAFNTENGAVLLDTGDGSNGSEISTAAGAVSFGKWHQVSAAINRSGATATLFVDGIQAGSGAVVSDFVNNADLNFGRFTNSALYFNGTMDEARIHSGIDDSNWVWASWATVASSSTFESYSAVTRALPDLTIGTGGNGNGGSIFLVWPSSGVGYGLYTTTNLTPPITWVPVTNQPLLTNNQWEINLPSSNSSVRFYRIQSQ